MNLSKDELQQRSKPARTVCSEYQKRLQLWRSHMSPIVNNTESKQVHSPDDPNGITRHHRKPTSIGGKNYKRNISYVPLFKHRAWHDLYQDKEAQEIITTFTTDYEIHGIDVIKSDLLKELHEKYANNTAEKIKRNKAWYTLFEGKSLERIVDEINTVWIDPDWEILISMIRVKTVQLIRSTVPVIKEKRRIKHL